jgi:hypothetical protein
MVFQGGKSEFSTQKSITVEKNPKIQKNPK